MAPPGTWDVSFFENVACPSPSAAPFVPSHAAGIARSARPGGEGGTTSGGVIASSAALAGNTHEPSAVRLVAGGGDGVVVAGAGKGKFVGSAALQTKSSVGGAVTTLGGGGDARAGEGNVVGLGEFVARETASRMGAGAVEVSGSFCPAGCSGHGACVQVGGGQGVGALGGGGVGKGGGGGESIPVKISLPWGAGAGGGGGLVSAGSRGMQQRFECRCHFGYYGQVCGSVCPGGAATPCLLRGTCHQDLGK